MRSPFCVDIAPDCEGFLQCLMRRRTPERVHAFELLMDAEVYDAIFTRFGLNTHPDASDPAYGHAKCLAVRRFLGYDFATYCVEGLDFPLNCKTVEDTACLPRKGGRIFVDEHRGPVTSWEEFERYRWPEVDHCSRQGLDWYAAHLPDGMCLAGWGGFGNVCEMLAWLMGYETLCVALCEQRDLVAAIARRLEDIALEVVDILLTYDCVRFILVSDDMGFRYGPLIRPDDLREFVLPVHKRVARKAHAAGRPYVLHSCGKIACILEDLINDVRIDAKHAFEDTIERVSDAKRAYGRRVALLGGINVDFLCWADEASVRGRVRETLDVCMAGGGYCLGTGNSVANYIPLNNYITMLDEGRRYAL